MAYPFRDIEQKWQQYWDAQQTFKAQEESGKTPYYVLDMFPYPSGAGLHVGHPLGYIASDIIARYHRHLGYEVLHPMGYDAFGLPAEQYAIDTGNHPASFTDQNIDRYREQLKMLGLSFDWSREVKTSDPSYYKWTQWIFLQLFDSWYNTDTDKAEPISELITRFARVGSQVNAARTEHTPFSADEWNGWSEAQQQQMLLNYRLAYIGESEVNWCPALGTVLANEEVQNGVSERGGYPVERVKMRQWFLRITAYAQRLLDGLDHIAWPEPLKEMQRNWIGKSVGAEILFEVRSSKFDQNSNNSNNSNSINIFTTRPDTIFGSTFMVLAPEHELVAQITTEDQREAVQAYIEKTKRKSERERISEAERMTGTFTGAYAEHPFTGKLIPIWIADYVLADYGTGAIMAVPGHDSRDWLFARTYSLPIVPVVEGGNIDKEAFETKEGRMINSDFLDGLSVTQAIEKAIDRLVEKGIGKKQVNYRLRDANFSRQRYWGEPFPIVWRNGLPYPVDESELPVTLPDVQSYKPTGTGESPLAAVEEWVNTPNGRRETNTMPGWAGSSWYYLRYMDPHNDEVFAATDKLGYWRNVDFYVGGSEHATSHLLYSRFWMKFLHDRGFVQDDEPFKKLINQGMIQGQSQYIYFQGMDEDALKVSLKEISFEEENVWINYTEPVTFFYSSDYYSNMKLLTDLTKRHVDVNLVRNGVLDIEGFKNWRRDAKKAVFICKGGYYDVHGEYIKVDNDFSTEFRTTPEVEKMSKSKYNVVTPDDVIEKYGCDSLRMYEMFLGPIEASKPWNTEGIDGVSRFLRKLWNLFYDDQDTLKVTEEAPTKEELKILHQTIKKVRDDIDRFSLNTCVSHFMILVNELGRMKCTKKDILQPMVILLSPFAPHIAEELWSEALKNRPSVAYQPYPKVIEEFLKEDTFEYPVSVNGKVRGKIELPLDLPKEEVEQTVVSSDIIARYTEGKAIKRVVVVPGRIVNVVV